MNNYLLQSWDTPFGLAPFDKISDSDFQPAFDFTLSEGLGEIDQIAKNTDPITFENTIEAMMASGQRLSNVMSVFYTLSSADTNDERDRLMQIFAPKLSQYYADIASNTVLFERVKFLWDGRENLELNAEQMQVLTLTYRWFVRAGANVKGGDLTRLKAIKKRLSELGTQFTQNMLGDEREWFMPLKSDQVVGLPDFLLHAAQQAGKEKEHDGPVVTLSRSIIVPFLQFCPDRSLREIAQKAWAARGANDNERDNRDIARETLTLRQEMVKILGYQSYAHYKLETEMAKTPENVTDLLNDVWNPAVKRAKDDAAVMNDMLRADGVNGELEKWDWHYYAQKRRMQEHNLDEAKVKPYFQLEQMINAAFECASRLFGLEFELVNDISLYHPDCRAWNVTRNGEHIALFIGDYFARSSKRSGAWCSSLRVQSRFPNKQTPIVLNVCNFAKAEPALLSFDDALTLFHEFGHALHQILSNVTYEMISGTQVARDFVELPSQLYEHWLTVPEVLQKYAVHAKTGEAMPYEMLQSVLDAANFDKGFETVEYLASAIVDLQYHLNPVPDDIMDEQSRILTKIGMPDAIGMRHATPHFAHVFSGEGYSSGYYSYMWAEVMDADAFSAFDDQGDPFDAALAASLEKNILSTGRTQEPEDLYIAFRGRLPKVDALLRGRGLIS